MGRNLTTFSMNDVSDIYERASRVQLDMDSLAQVLDFGFLSSHNAAIAAKVCSREAAVFSP